GDRDFAGAANIDRHRLLLLHAVGLTHRHLHGLADGLVAAHLHLAGLTDLDLLAVSDRALFGHHVRHPALAALGPRAGFLALRSAWVGAAVVLARAQPLERAGGRGHFASFIVAAVDDLAFHFGDLLGDPAFLHDRLLFPVRDALADVPGFHDRF